MLFFNSSAPSGWSQKSGNNYNSRALQLVRGSDGTGGSFSSGGSAFTTIFGSSKSTNNHTLTTAQIPAHFHYSFRSGNAGQLRNGSNLSANNYPASGTGAGNLYESYNITASGSQPNVGRTQEIGSSQGHSHNMNMNVRYANVIMCEKN